MPPKAVDAVEALHPEPSLSRPWAAPTTAPSMPIAGGASTGGYTRGPSPCWYVLRPSRRGPPAREAAMGRSYNSAVLAHLGRRIDGGIYKGSLPLLVRPAAKPPRAAGPRGGHGPLLQQRGPCPSRVAHRRGDIQGVPPLVGTSCGQAAAGRRPERRPWAAPTTVRSLPISGGASTGGYTRGPSPCWYALRPSRRGPPAREAAMGRSHKKWSVLRNRKTGDGFRQPLVPIPYPLTTGRTSSTVRAPSPPGT